MPDLWFPLKLNACTQKYKVTTLAAIQPGLDVAMGWVSQRQVPGGDAVLPASLPVPSSPPGKSPPVDPSVIPQTPPGLLREQVSPCGLQHCKTLIIINKIKKKSDGSLVVNYGAEQQTRPITEKKINKTRSLDIKKEIRY